MPGYTKLFNSIIASTIWREDDKTRIVWITLLAMADKHGRVEASIPGLADFARVELSDCEVALNRLMAPDKYSRSQDDDGRRIREIDGGWELINYGKYRLKLGIEERQDYNRIKKAEERQRKRDTVNTVNDTSDKSAMSAHSRSRSRSRVQSTEALVPITRSSFDLFWEAYPRKVGKYAAIKVWTKRRPTQELTAQILKAIEAQKQTDQWMKDGGQFIPHPATWLNQGRWEDSPVIEVPKLPVSDKTRRTMKNLQQWMNDDGTGQTAIRGPVAGPGRNLRSGTDKRIDGPVLGSPDRPVD